MSESLPDHSAPTTWRAVIRAPQGGPIHVHEVYGDKVQTVAERIAEGFDFENADRVDITITRWEK